MAELPSLVETRRPESDDVAASSFSMLPCLFAATSEDEKTKRKASLSEDCMRTMRGTSRTNGIQSAGRNVESEGEMIYRAGPCGRDQPQCLVLRKFRNRDVAETGQLLIILRG